MPKRVIDRPIVPPADRPPAGLTRRQLRRWNDDLVTRRQAETAAVLEAAALAAMVMGPAVPPEQPRPGVLRRAWSAVWGRRPLLFTLGLMAVMLVIVISTQISYYRPMAGLTPEFGASGWLRVRVYLTVPVITELLSMQMACLAGYVIDRNRGRYTRYIRMMWAFAAVGAAVNLRGGWEHIADGTHVIAFVLAGMSLAVPLVWHSYTGMRIAVDITGMSIAEIARIGRQWTRHPRLSYSTARAVELFPELSRDEVWERVSHAARAKRDAKWNGVETSGNPRAQLDRAVHNLRSVRSPEDLKTWWKDRAPAGGDQAMNKPGNIGETNVFPDVHESSHPPTSDVHILVAEPPTPAETTGDIRVRDMVVRAWFEVHGEHLVHKREQPRGYQTQLAADVHRSKSYVSKIFTDCRNGVYPNPFTVNEPDKE